ncbi:MAG: LacI family DNA-binding transcriptional regulator [Oscillospiraceae bacterium]|nr:LacI family DNA-binding transcriptional regulator [Oscillospiraceae bacterium]
MGNTIKDVARLAGVSVATVSRVLNNSATVSEETAQQVKNTIKELNYRPNFLGRNLRKRETHVILALIPSTEHTYYSEILHGMQSKGSEFGYDILMSTTNSNLKTEMRLLEMISNRTVDGAVLMGTRLDKNMLCEMNQYNGVALCCETVEGSDILTVKIDNEAAAYDAVNCMISKGHKRIAMISTDVRASSSVEREKGYMRALRDNGIEFNTDYLYQSSYDYINGSIAVEQFMKLDKKPTAVFAISDFIAAGAVIGANKLGLNVGKDFAVMGFDNISMCEMFMPTISTVEQPCFKIGEVVAERLIENISGKFRNTGIVNLDHRLVLRQSTGD